MPCLRRAMNIMQQAMATKARMKKNKSPMEQAAIARKVKEQTKLNAERFARSDTHQAKRKLELEQQEAEKKAQEEEHLRVHELEQQKEADEKEHARLIALSVEERRKEEQAKLNQEYQGRKKYADDWQFHYMWEHIKWTREHGYKQDWQLKLEGIEEPINPTMHWFDTKMFIKPQFKDLFEANPLPEGDVVKF